MGATTIKKRIAAVIVSGAAIPLVSLAGGAAHADEPVQRASTVTLEGGDTITVAPGERRVMAAEVTVDGVRIKCPPKGCIIVYVPPDKPKP